MICSRPNHSRSVTVGQLSSRWIYRRKKGPLKAGVRGLVGESSRGPSKYHRPKPQRLYWLGLFALIEPRPELEILSWMSKRGLPTESMRSPPTGSPVQWTSSMRPSLCAFPHRIDSNAPISDKFGIRWRFSSAAEVYFMEREATFGNLGSCVAAGRCLDRQTSRPEKGVILLAGCAPSVSTALPVDCLTQDEAKTLCTWLGSRLPSEGEWLAEFTASSRSFPYLAQQDCKLENMLRSDSVPERWFFEGRELIAQMCDGTSMTLGCSHQDRSASGLCDLGGNLGEWSSTEGKMLGLFVKAFVVSGFVVNKSQVRSAMVGVRCVKDVASVGPEAAWSE
jgi:hypothetical protein